MTRNNPIIVELFDVVPGYYHTLPLSLCNKKEKKEKEKIHSVINMHRLISEAEAPMLKMLVVFQNVISDSFVGSLIKKMEASD